MAKAVVNFSNLNSEFLKGLNTAKAMVTELAKAEKALKDATTNYNTERGIIAGHKLTESEKADKSAYLKPYRAEVKAINARLDGYTTLLFGKFIPFDNFTDIYHMDILEFLKCVGVASDNATMDNIKDSALRKVSILYKSVVGRVKPESTKRKKCDDFFTFTESKEIKDTSAEVVLAFYVGLQYTECFEEIGGALVSKF